MKKISLWVLGLLAIFGGLFLALAPSSTHATFNANNLMDDGVFDNVNSIGNAAEIDAWINQFPRSCISPGNGFTSPEPIGYNPTQGFLYGSNVSAGTVIYDSAQVYGLNPGVILATLQKESSVVTGDASYGCQYINTAMGYDCPDSGNCPRNPATESGFSKQVIHAVWALKYWEQRSKGNVGWDVQRSNFPHAGDNWDNSDDPQNCYSLRMTQGTYQTCPSGSSNYYDGWYTIDATAVHMDTAATASLYNYTPHFHGNQNFDDLYQQWFGSLYVPSYSWQLTGQNAYTDATKTVPKGMNGVLPGDRIYVTFTAKNTGNQTWSNSGANPIMVGTVSPLERQSAFSAGSGWLSPTRPALLKESTVSPGGTGTFEFWMTVPSISGVYNERFGLIANGTAWFNDTGLSYFVGVAPIVYSWQMMSQNAYTDATKTVPKGMNGVLPGDRIYVTFTAKNTGNQTWSNSGANPIRVGTLSPIERVSVFAPGSSWLGSSRPAQMTEASISPGGTGTFEFWMTVPSISGVYNERFGLVAEGKTWFNDTGLSYFVGVAPIVYSWQFVGQWAYTDANRTIVANMANMHPGDKVYVRFTAKNTGNITWFNTGSNPIMAGTANPFDRISSFAPGSSWLSGSRPVLMQNPSIAPGETATFEFTMTAPNILGVYNERFNLIANNLIWFDDTGLSYYAKVQ